MNYTKLGSTGLDVSRICLGCMSYGGTGRGNYEWTLDEAASRPFFERALEAGINFFDTANVYSAGSSEEITGRALRELANRDEIVLATKVMGPMRQGPNGRGLSRKAIFAEIDASLTRLGTDYVDLYQFIAGIGGSRSRRPWRPSTTWSRRARPATSARRRCGRGSSPRRCTLPSATAGPGS